MRISELISESPSRKNPQGPAVVKAPVVFNQLLRYAFPAEMKRLPDKGFPKALFLETIGGDHELAFVILKARLNFRQTGVAYADQAVDSLEAELNRIIQRRMVS